jgi:cytochrome b561
MVIRFVNRHYSTLPPSPATMSQREGSVAPASELFVCAAGCTAAGRLGNVVSGALSDRTVWVAASFPILPHSVMLYAMLRRTHTVLAYLLFLTFIAHFGAVLFHTLIVRDGMFSRMAPWRVRAS